MNSTPVEVCLLCQREEGYSRNADVAVKSPLVTKGAEAVTNGGNVVTMPVTNDEDEVTTEEGPLSNAERQRRWREKNREKSREQARERRRRDRGDAPVVDEGDFT